MEQKGRTSLYLPIICQKWEEKEKKKEGRVKVIIDTDPGIDDAFAVLASLSCMPELDVVALASSFGNVRTEKATENCKKLLRISKKTKREVLVAEGSKKALNGKQKEHVADFVHGKDGFGIYGGCHGRDGR